MAVTKKITKSFSKSRWSELTAEQCLDLSEVSPELGGAGLGRDFSLHGCLLFSFSAVNQEGWYLF